MKICFFIPSLENGGAERVVSLLANEMSKENEVYILLLNGTKSDYYISEQVKIVGFNCIVDRQGNKMNTFISIIKNEICRYNNYKQAINRIKPDAIISMLFTTNMISILANFSLKKKLIVSERNDPLSYAKIKQLCIKFFYKKARYIVCQSSLVKSYFNSNNAVVIYNPIYNEQQDKEELNIKMKTRFRIITAGRLIEQKNHKMLIEVMKVLLEKGVECELFIFGEGPLRRELENLIKKYNLEDYIFLPGYTRNLKSEMKGSDLFVLASDFEGFPNVLLEAISCNIPVISTDFSTGAAREMIKENVNGYLIRVGAEVELENKIKLVINKELDLDMLRRYNRKIIEKFSVKKISAQWLDVLNG